MLTYINKLKVSLMNLLLSSPLAQTGVNKSQTDTLKLNQVPSIDLKIQRKCIKAQEELRYMRRFSHWPVSQLKHHPITALTSIDKEGIDKEKTPCRTTEKISIKTNSVKHNST